MSDNEMDRMQRAERFILDGEERRARMVDQILNWPPSILINPAAGPGVGTMSTETKDTVGREDGILSRAVKLFHQAGELTLACGGTYYQLMQAVKDIDRAAPGDGEGVLDEAAVPGKIAEVGSTLSDLARLVEP